MTVRRDDLAENEPSSKSFICSVGIELLPIVCAIACGVSAAVAGAFFFDWTIAIIGAALGAFAGVVVGFVAQSICSVVLIWINAMKAAMCSRNYLPLLCGVGAAIVGTISLICDGAGNDLDLIVFGFLVSFTFGAAFAAMAQGVWRRFNR